MALFTTILFEFIFITFSILSLFKFRDKLGLAPLYILLGAIQYLQANLGTMVSFKFFETYTIYPGSVILFGAVLFTVLLLYIKEGVASARALIFGIIISNSLMSVLFEITYTQEVINRTIRHLDINTSSLFHIDYKFFIIGTIILVIDFFLLVVMYQYLISNIKKKYYFFVLFISLLTVLVFESIIFNTALFYAAPTFNPTIISQIIGKSIAAFIFSVILFLYLKYVEKEDIKTTFINNQTRGVLSILDYRKKYFDIKSEKKEIEQKLNIHLNNTLNNISDGFVSLDTNWRYTFINKKGGEFLGRTPSSLIGKHIWTEFPEGVGLPFYNAYYKAVETQQTQYFQEYYEPFDKWFENRVYPSSDGLSIYFTDITEKKKTEKIIIQKEKELNIIYQTSAQPIFIIKVEGGHNYKFISVSNSFLNILNITEEEVINKPVREIIPEPSLNLVLEKYKEAIKSKNSVQWEETTPYNNGIKTAIVTISPLFEVTGYCTHLVGIINDITERKKTEALLFKSERYLDNIINNIGDPVFVKDDQSHLLLVNDAFCKLFNLKKDDIIGKTLVEEVPLDEMESFLRIDKQVLNTGIENINEENLTIKGEETRIISTKKTRFLDDNGNKYLIGIIRDITERKKTEIELEKHRNQLEELVNLRTKEVNNKNTELQRMNKLFVGRELKMKELKNIIKGMQLKNDN